jgi:NCAIR mutase (PurE)-related protein
MDRDRLRALLESVQRGEVEPSQALESLAHLPFIDTPHARVDTHRALRQGLPEVVYGPGKTAAQIAEVVRAQQGAGLPVLVTRVEAATADAVLREIPGGEHDATARLLCYGTHGAAPTGNGLVPAMALDHRRGRDVAGRDVRLGRRGAVATRGNRLR